VAEISPLMDPIVFGTFNFITSVDRNRSNFQNLMFQKPRYIISKIIVMFIVRYHCQKHLGLGTIILDSVDTVLLDKWFLSNTKNQATSDAVSHLRRLNCRLHGLKMSETYTKINFLITKNAVRKVVSRCDAVSIIEFLCIRMSYLQMGCSV
jgi:hypothetical protein